MILILRRNHFFRSAWDLTKMGMPAQTELKYFDLDTVSEEMWLRKCRFYKLKSPAIHTIDVSYWNTYHATIPRENVFYILLDFYLGMHVYGIKNLRSENMSNSDFEMMLESSSSEHYNNDWKTAHLTYIFPFNPHWNMCHEKNVNMNDSNDSNDSD